MSSLIRLWPGSVHGIIVYMAALAACGVGRSAIGRADHGLRFMVKAGVCLWSGSFRNMLWSKPPTTNCQYPWHPLKRKPQGWRRRCQCSFLLPLRALSSLSACRCTGGFSHGTAWCWFGVAFAMAEVSRFGALTKSFSDAPVTSANTDACRTNSPVPSL